MSSPYTAGYASFINDPTRLNPYALSHPNRAEWNNGWRDAYEDEQAQSNSASTESSEPQTENSQE